MKMEDITMKNEERLKMALGRLVFHEIYHHIDAVYDLIMSKTMTKKMTPKQLEEFYSYLLTSDFLSCFSVSARPRLDKLARFKAASARALLSDQDPDIKESDRRKQRPVDAPLFHQPLH